MPVVPPYHLTKFDACGPPLPFDPNLIPVVPPYHLTEISSLWSPFQFYPNLMPVVPLTIRHNFDVS